MKPIPIENTVDVVQWYSKIYIITLSLVLMLLGTMEPSRYPMLEDILAIIFSAAGIALIAFSYLTIPAKWEGRLPEYE